MAAVVCFAHREALACKLAVAVPDLDDPDAGHKFKAVFKCVEHVIRLTDPGLHCEFVSRQRPRLWRWLKDRRRKHDNSSKRDRGFVRLADYFVAEAKSGTDTSRNLFSRGCMLEIGRRRLIDSPGVSSLYAAVDAISAIFDNVDAIDRGRLGVHGR